MKKQNRISWQLAKIPRWKLVSVIMVLLLVLSFTVTLAYYLNTSPAVQNFFRFYQVSCQVTETFDGTQKTSIQVQNTSSVEAYVRVRLVSYWQTPSGKIAGKASELPTVDYDTANWIYDAANETYYYQHKVDLNGETSNLLATAIQLKNPEQNEGYIHVVKVLAEAIQAEPGDAVNQAWPYVTVDTDGRLTQRTP